MKRMILVALIASAMFSITALADDIILTDNDYYKVVLHDIEKTTNYDGKPTIALDMTLTVKQDDAASPMVIIEYDLTAFQDGKSIRTTIDGDKSAFSDISGNYVTELKNGASEEFSVYYLLESESDVELEFDSFDTVTLYYSLSTDEITTDAPTEEPDPDYKAMYEELKVEYDELLEKYNELVEE